MTTPEVSIILACYNEGPSFENSVLKTVKLLARQKMSWEIIFVEDKSLDETRKTLEKLASEIKNSKVIYHAKNEGRGKSVADGILASRGKICGYLDVDLEVSETYIPIFVSEIEAGADMVVGKRFYESGFKGLNRYLASRAYSYLVRRLLKIPISDTEAGYKFFDRSKILPILKTIRSRGWFWDTEICARSYWAGLKITDVPVLFVRRSDKKSTVKLFSDSLDYFFSILKFRKQMPKKFLNVQ